MKHLKKWRYLYFFIACFIIGFLTMPLFHSGYMNQIWKSFKAIKWYYQTLMFLGTLFLTLALHELTHFISFLFSGYKNEMMIILFFVFYKKESRWKVKIDFKLLLLGGGMVFPSLGEINSQEEFLKAKKAMGKSLLAAPVFTLVSGVVLFIVVFVFFYKIPFLVPFSIYFLLFSLLYTYLSSKEAPNVYGDFKAYKKIKTDEEFALLIVSQYASSLPDYLLKNMQNHLAFQTPIKMDLVSQSYFSILLDMALQKDEIDYFILKKVYYYFNNLNYFKSLINSSDNLDMLQGIIFYLDRLNYKAEANKLLNVYISTLETSKIDKKTINYYIKQTKHILKLTDETEFLNNSNNISKGPLTFIMRNIPSFVESEKSKNEGYNQIKPFLPLIII